jgi:hypothetical protein
MTDSVPTLDALPAAAQIADLRRRAADEGDAVEVAFPAANGETKRFVVSPRGTCVVLTNLREETFNPSVAPEAIAAALRE